jgi:hypothetical protein
MIDPTGAVIVALRDDAAVRAIVGQHGTAWKVRGDEPGAGWLPPFITVTFLTSRRDTGGDAGTWSLDVMETYLSVKCYGTTPQQAIQLYGAASDALHGKQFGADSSGRLLYLVADDGTSGDVDPAGRPLQDFTAIVTAAAHAVA